MLTQQTTKVETGEPTYSNSGSEPSTANTIVSSESILASIVVRLLSLRATVLEFSNVGEQGSIEDLRWGEQNTP